VERKYNRKISVFNVHEFGKNGKKHWHLIVFNFNFSDKEIYTIKNGNSLYTSKTLERLWPFGFNTIGDVSEASAMYQAQYSQKDFKNGNITNGKRSHSKHSGIGKPYFEKHYDQILRLGYIPFNGSKLPVPRYFQKLAHKNWAWFNDRSYFYDSKIRDRVYTPFSTDTEANPDMGDLWPMFKMHKDLRVTDLETKWSATLDQYLTTLEDPDFIKSNSNNLYDLQRKTTKEMF